MTHRRSRWLGGGLLASGGAGLLAAMSTLNAAPALADDGTALIMGYWLTPDPGESYLDQVTDLFIDPLPGDYTPVIQDTTETDYQSGLAQSVAQVHQGIMDHLDDGKVVVFGYSQSAAIATQEMINLANLPADERPDPDDLRFVLVENPNAPNGGTFERFASPIADSNLPATPVDTPYETDIYTIEYSGIADLPKYPLNPFAMANAMAGYIYLHPFLLPGWSDTFDESALADAVQLPEYDNADDATDYFLIPTQDLPLLAGLRSTPLVGEALADLIQPDLRVLVDLGYDRTDPADVVTPAQWNFPTIDWDTVFDNLALGAQQGWIAAQVDLGLLPESALPTTYPYVPDLPGLIDGTTPTELVPDAAAAAGADLPSLDLLDFFSL